MKKIYILQVVLNQHAVYNSMQHAQQVALLSAKTPSVEQAIIKCYPSTSDRIVDKIIVKRYDPL